MTIARLPGRGTLRRVDAIGKGPHLRPVQGDLRITLGGPERGLETWRTPWPAAGCNKPAECQGPSCLQGGPLRRKPSKPGGTARTEHPGSGRPGYTDALRRVRGQVDAAGMTGGGDIDEPHERSPTEGRPRGRPTNGPHELESVSEEEASGTEPKGATGGVGEGQRAHLTDAGTIFLTSVRNRPDRAGSQPPGGRPT